MRILLTQLRLIDIAPVLNALTAERGPVGAWVLEDLDCTGAGAQTLADMINARPRRRLALTAARLYAAAPDFGQLIEGTFAAFADAAAAAAFADAPTSVSVSIEDGRALFALVVRDGDILELLLPPGLDETRFRTLLRDTLGEINQDRFAGVIRQDTPAAEPGVVAINELDVVQLTEDIPECGLARGDIGAVVTRFDISDEAFDIEFVNPDGSTRCICTVKRHQFTLVRTPIL